ncbi:MAG: heme-dependent oxidative N-demethylase subunit alpha family protein [Limisphaerales bacterium]
MTESTSFSPAAARLPDADVFPDADFQHRLRFGRCAPGDFFGPWPGERDLPAERRHWIATHPDRHVLADDGASDALLELAGFVAIWTGEPVVVPPRTPPSSVAALLGTVLEPDWLLLERAPGSARLIAGCVCFPSSWSPRPKLGAGLARIHAVVPGLNAAIGGAIDGFLARLKPGHAWIRANWGLSASAERNQHPERSLPRFGSAFDPAATWVRIEHQSLLVLPRTSSILFGIRIEHRPLASLVRQPALARSLARALRTLPEPMAAYKGIAGIRTAAADHLHPGPSGC